MAQYFSGYDGLVEAIQAATNYEVETRVAANSIMEAYQAAGTAGVNQLAADYGISAFGTKEAVQHAVPTFWRVGAIEGATPTAAETLYPAALDTALDTTTNEVVFETAKTATTEGGKLLSKGAIKTATTALSVVGAVATGVEHLLRF